MAMRRFCLRLGVRMLAYRIRKRRDMWLELYEAGAPTSTLNAWHGETLMHEGRLQRMKARLADLDHPEHRQG